MRLETTILNLRTRKAGGILLHVLLWLFYFSAILYFNSISFNGYLGNVAIYEPLKNITTTILVYYPLVYLVWPKYLVRRKYLMGILLIALLIIIYTTADHLLERLIMESCESCMAQLKLNQHGYYQLFQRGAINVILVQLISLGIIYQLFVFLAFPIAMKMIMAYFDQRIKTLVLQKENIQLEFNFLKAQVNPHFLFNTLNNIYALILRDDKKASSETVTKLAGFLRYSLYESDTHSNNIIKEVNLLETYIELERIRLNDTVVNFIKKIDNEEYTIPPLLFMPAVENAFKYCSGNSDGDAYIFMKLEIEGSELIFMISNTFDKMQHSPGIYSGIGLQNLQKRLDHYYPGKRSSLHIVQDHSLYQIIIKLNLA